MNLKIFSLALIAGLTLIDDSAQAANFQPGVTRDGTSYITIDGEINVGDAYKFSRIVSSFISAGKPIRFVALNSPGGYVDESFTISNIIIDAKLNTVVPDNWMCASACVLIFGSGRERHAYPNSTIAVHRIATSNSDPLLSKALSVDMASTYENFHFPPNVTVKMLTTPPEKIYELTPEEKIEISKSSANITQLAYNLKQGGISTPVTVITDNDRLLARKYNDNSVDLINTGQFELAIQQLEKAKSLSPADAEILGNLGYAYFNNGDYEKAKSNLTASLKLMPKRGVSWNNLGQALGAQNQIEWASDCFQKYWNYTSNKLIVEKLFNKLEQTYKGTSLNGIYEAVHLARQKINP